MECENMKKHTIGEKMAEKTVLDLDVLTLLREDSKRDIITIADTLKIKPSSAFKKITFLEKNIIKKHVPLIDFKKLGYNMNSFILIKVDSEEKDLLGDFLYRYKNINNLFMPTSDYDFIVQVFHKKKKNFDDFVDLINELFQVEKIIVIPLIGVLRNEDFIF
jgi:Lrp/AsnC family leucine-responsive transcriptional regulator